MRLPLMMLLQLAGGVTGVIQRVVLAWRLFRDGRVPLLTKAIPTAGVAYAVSPLDVIPDWLIGPGHIDDVVVAFLGVWFFVVACPRWLVEEHRRAMSGFPPGSGGDRGAAAGDKPDGEVVDVEARVVERKR